jgi:hypothetical protein
MTIIVDSSEKCQRGPVFVFVVVAGVKANSIFPAIQDKRLERESIFDASCKVRGGLVL